MDERLEREKKHGKHIREAWKGSYWYWETPAGEVRWQRRLKMLFSHITPQMKVLECGCGLGHFTQSLAKTNAQIIAIDISNDFLDIAREKVKAENVTFKMENAYDLKYEGNSFDSVVGSSVLHHLDVDKALKEFFRLLKVGGTIYFTEPNMLNPQIFLERKVPFIRNILGVSLDEAAFIRGPLFKKMKALGYEEIVIYPFDFLHPLTPKVMIPLVSALGNVIEKTPILKEIAGSLFITAKKLH